jgi:hypothetical protein
MRDLLGRPRAEARANPCLALVLLLSLAPAVAHAVVGSELQAEGWQASFFERLKRPLVESWAGENAPARVLRYVFCGRHQRGDVVESPYLGSPGFIWALRPADSPTDRWFTKHVDIAADYRQAFGEEPPNPAQIAIQADTDNTRSASRASVADLACAARAG